MPITAYIRIADDVTPSLAQLQEPHLP